jgi:hypothetical protein
MSTTDTQTPGTLIKGNVISAGDITVLDEANWPTEKRKARRFTGCLLIQFKSVEDIQRAIAEGRVEFTMFD